MLKAVLFDLDNTLILYDEMKFLKIYFPLVAGKFADILPPDEFAERLMKATLVLHKNDGRLLNREAFLNSFCEGLQQSRDEIWKRFEDFYQNDFDHFKDMVVIPDHARDVFLNIGRKNLKIVIATNPIWPLNAQMKRLSWAGLGDIDFALITNIDNMTFCKPQIGYYQEICRKIGERAEDCLMVGDDPANDMVVARIGMRTYLTVDSLNHVESPLALSKQVIGNNTEGIPPADFKGPLARVPEAVDTLLQGGPSK